MYLGPNTTYIRNGTMRTHSDRYLILVLPPIPLGEEAPPIRAIVRKVALKRIEGLDIGTARAWGFSIPITGAYGANGHPREVPRTVYENAEEVPAHLREAFARDGAHRQLRAWARKRFPEVSI